jgi:hypothetical protein
MVPLRGADPLRGGALPPGLLCAALGFALAFAPWRIIPVCIAALVATAGLVVWHGVAVAWRDWAFIGCWISVIAAAASVHLPRGPGPRLAVMLSVNVGAWAGAVIAVAGAPIDLVKSLPFVLLCAPGAWLVSTGRKIALKVAASWLIAVAILVSTLPVLTPTPGYVADHMD